MKFNEMRTQGNNPPYILALYDGVPPDGEDGKRAHQTKLINQMFRKSDDGKRWVLNLRDQTFTESCSDLIFCRVCKH